MSGDEVGRWLRLAAERFDGMAGELDRVDAVAGDGDHGTAMRRGARAAADAAEGAADAGEPCAVALRLAGVALMSSAGGTSGALFGSMLVSMAGSWDDGLQAALTVGMARVTALGKAAPGDKTMLDALEPAVAAARRGPRAAAEAAVLGRDATAALAARAGRARHVAGGGAGTADPGACSVAVLLAALADVTEPERDPA